MSETWACPRCRGKLCVSQEQFDELIDAVDNMTKVMEKILGLAEANAAEKGEPNGSQEGSDSERESVRPVVS